MRGTVSESARPAPRPGRCSRRALLLSPIAWHNYLLLLVPGMLVLVALGRRASSTAALAVAVAVIPGSWNAEWPPDGLGSDLARSLYCAILIGYWLVLLSGTR